MIAPPIGYPIGCLTGDPKGYPNRPRIARIESSRVVSCRPLLKTRVAGNTTSFSQVTREPRDAMVEALTRPDRRSA